MPDRTVLVIWLLNLALLALGLGALKSTVRQARALQSGIERRHQDLVMLNEFQASKQAGAAYRKVFENLPVNRPVRIASLLGGLSAEISTESERPVESGWSARRVRVAVDDAPFESLGGFLERANGQRPPWRLEKIELVATEKGARAVMILEALEKAAP